MGSHVDHERFNYRLKVKDNVYFIPYLKSQLKDWDIVLVCEQLFCKIRPFGGFWWTFRRRRNGPRSFARENIAVVNIQWRHQQFIGLKKSRQMLKVDGRWGLKSEKWDNFSIWLRCMVSMYVQIRICDMIVRWYAEVRYWETTSD